LFMGPMFRYEFVMSVFFFFPLRMLETKYDLPSLGNGRRARWYLKTRVKQHINPMIAR